MGSWDTEMGCARAHVQRYPTKDLHKTHGYWVPSHPLNFSTMRRAVPEIWKRGAHVRTCRYTAECRCTPPMTCGKHLGIGTQPIHQNLNTIGQAVPKIQKHGVLMRTCRDTPLMICGKHIVHGPQPTHQIWTQSAKPFLRYRSAVCTCARADEGTPPMPFVKCIANGHPTTYQISTHSAHPLPSNSKISFFVTILRRHAPRAVVTIHM